MRLPLRIRPLVFSEVFEMIEWAAALVVGHVADDFLATQGDAWDTRWDMFRTRQRLWW
ncbi:DUF2238 domain-containing protein [Streptomyces sp. NPDC053427]|uniref:DUF2238 domain-containing protein n=1 Tax=Streptomyces sp. NPDC053427 TaxID=3365701 RepID=UPI0037D475C4